MTEIEGRNRDAAAVHAEPDAEPPALIAGDDSLMEGIIAALRTVYDPEIPVNIYDLGLIYRIEPGSDGHVDIDMTLTAPGCPVAGELLNMVQGAVRELAAISSVNVNLVFDPPWDNSRMTDDVKLELGLL